MSDSLEHQIDVGGGDVPVTNEDVKLFNQAPAKQVSDQGSSPKPGAEASTEQSEPRRERAADVDPSQNDDDEGQDERFSRAGQSRHTRRRDIQRQARLRSEQRIQQLEQHVAELTTALRGQMVGTAANTLETLDNQFAQVRAQFQAAENRHATAIANGDGPLATQALADRDAAVEQARRIEVRRAQLADNVQRHQAAPQRQPVPQQIPAVDPELASHAVRFMKDKPWYNLNGQDRDSVLVSSLDVALTSEGLDPRDQEYWDELDARVREALPHRFEGANGARRGPPVRGGGASGRSTPAAPNPLTPHRIEAMKQAGIWDDDEKRERMIQRYREFDKQSQGTR